MYDVLSLVDGTSGHNYAADFKHSQTVTQKQVRINSAKKYNMEMFETLSTYFIIAEMHILRIFHLNSCLSLNVT
jgi:hypothetical protein